MFSYGYDDTRKKYLLNIPQKKSAKLQYLNKQIRKLKNNEISKI